MQDNPLKSFPDDIEAALNEAAKAGARFAALPPSHRHEYLRWIGDAKTPAARAHRIAQMRARLEAEPVA